MIPKQAFCSIIEENVGSEIDMTPIAISTIPAIAPTKSTASPIEVPVNPHNLPDYFHNNETSCI